MKKIIFPLVVISFFLVITTSCFKEDVKIAPHPVDTTKVEMIAMTQYYMYQVYFNLNTGEQVSQNVKSDFDLQFSCYDTGFIIKLNSASFVMAAATQQTEFSQVTDTAGLNWRFDASSGNLDSLALKNWIQFSGSDTIYPENVYVINRGLDSYGNALGLRKIIFHKLLGDRYYFSYCRMDNSDLQEVIIAKDFNYNTVQYSFGTNEVVQTEPIWNEWDLLFTQYSTMLTTDEGQDYPYLLTGVLINSGDVKVHFDSTMVFNDVTVDEVLNLDFTSQPDAIGYNWKELIGDINGGDFYYECHSNWNYFVQTRTGVYYKLRFTSFYDPITGEKGYPTFEYRRL
jgi:hypothetical protein